MKTKNNETKLDIPMDEKIRELKNLRKEMLN